MADRYQVIDVVPDRVVTKLLEDRDLEPAECCRYGPSALTTAFVIIGMGVMLIAGLMFVWSLR